MLFNSYEFLFLFLIPVYFGFVFLRKLKSSFGLFVWFLVLVSILFYAEWSLQHLSILLGSVLVNFIVAKMLLRAKVYRSVILSLGIFINLIPLIYYKYAFYESSHDNSIVLPLAISFFTFQQIAFLVDIYKQKVVLQSLREYAFFILFFPQLVAGPIVHYNELIPQIRRKKWLRFDTALFNKGILLFSIGLFKKVVIADTLATLVNSSFTPALNSSVDAWLGVFAYSFEIYFDFSGYTDMAIGLGLLFGVELPINFNSPYKSRNIVEFWRRWHITLSHFLRDYIYIPLGGNRAGEFRQVLNLLITMLLGGIWHGVGWNFFMWGALHGILLAFVHRLKIQLPKYLAILLSFLGVSLLWVLFRSEDLTSALHYYRVLFAFEWSGSAAVSQSSLLLCMLLLAVVWILPNSNQFSGYKKSAVRMTKRHAFVAALLFFISLKVMASAPAQTFVYFNF